VKWQNAYLINTRPRVQTPVPPKKKKRRRRRRRGRKRKKWNSFETPTALLCLLRKSGVCQLRFPERCLHVMSCLCIIKDSDKKWLLQGHFVGLQKICN
jgi:hypothetical protein